MNYSLSRLSFLSAQLPLAAVLALGVPLALGACTADGPGDSAAKVSSPRIAKADTTGVEGACIDSCRWAGDGECDDGRPGADWAVCDAGSDCTDCGPWTETVCPLTGVLCTPECPADGRLPSGAPCQRGEYDSTTCECEPIDPACPPTGVRCDPSCPDAGELGGVPCQRGTWSDAGCSCEPSDTCAPTGIPCDPACGPDGTLPGGIPCQAGRFDPATCSCVALCEDSCPWAGDGECDDGRPGADYSLCAFGTDCADCGPTS